jgi:hypothetical protein
VIEYGTLTIMAAEKTRSRRGGRSALPAIPHVESYCGLGKILPQIREKRGGPW